MGRKLPTTSADAVACRSSNSRRHVLSIHECNIINEVSYPLYSFFFSGRRFQQYALSGMQRRFAFQEPSYVYLISLPHERLTDVPDCPAPSFSLDSAAKKPPMIQPKHLPVIDYIPAQLHVCQTHRSLGDTIHYIHHTARFVCFAGWISYVPWRVLLGPRSFRSRRGGITGHQRSKCGEKCQLKLVEEHRQISV